MQLFHKRRYSTFVDWSDSLKNLTVDSVDENTQSIDWSTMQKSLNRQEKSSMQDEALKQSEGMISLRTLDDSGTIKAHNSVHNLRQPTFSESILLLLMEIIDSRPVSCLKLLDNKIQEMNFFYSMKPLDSTYFHFPIYSIHQEKQQKRQETLKLLDKFSKLDILL